MRRTMWLFRSNLKPLEYYHQYTNLEEFRKKCHDFYLLMGLYLLENDFIDEFVTWRIQPGGQHDYVFDINRKRFIQRWVNNFGEIFNPMYNHGTPLVSFFRGGFFEYDELTLKFADRLGIKLYLGAGRRVTPQYGGIYDKILVEDQAEVGGDHIPFYKTGNPEIFKPLKDQKIKYDLCWVCNFKQYRFKGQEFFIKSIGDSAYLKKLRIIHIGNAPKMGRSICLKYGVDNIEFVGSVDRPTLNSIINTAKFGIMTSDKGDGCPRVITEILCSGTPLLIRKLTRLLKYYKQFGVLEYNDKDLDVQVKSGLDFYDTYKGGAVYNLENRLTTKKICELNWNLWKNE